MKQLIKLATISTLSIFAYGCSSSDGDDTPSTPDGIYSGKITGGNTIVNGNERAIVNNKRMIVISHHDTNDIQQVFDSTLSITDSSFTSTSSTLYGGASLSVNNQLNTSGTIKAGSSITADFSDVDTTNPAVDPGTITLTYNTNNSNKSASLTLLTGTWTGDYGFWATATIDIKADGTFDGSEDGTSCAFSGSITVPDSNKNAYNVSLTSIFNCPSLPPGDYNGLAWLEGANNTTLILSVTGDTNNRSIIFTK